MCMEAALVACSIDEAFCVSIDMKSRLGDCIPLLAPLLAPLSMCSETGG